MFGGSEININFPKNIWVHLTYQTAFVDEDGKLQLREDVYGRDARMIAILKGSERKVADIAIERAPDTVVQAGAHAGRHVWRRRRLQRRRLLRLPVRRGARAVRRRSRPIGRRAPSARASATMDAILPLTAQASREENAGETIAGVFVLRGVVPPIVPIMITN